MLTVQTLLQKQPPPFNRTEWSSWKYRNGLSARSDSKSTYSSCHCPSLERLFNELMEIEREQVLCADPFINRNKSSSSLSRIADRSPGPFHWPLSLAPFMAPFTFESAYQIQSKRHFFQENHLHGI